MNPGWCSRLRDRHAGQHAVLVCNGPSLRQMDLGFLRREVVIGMNKIFLGFRDFGFYPKYYVAVNRKVLEQSAHEIRGLSCIKFLSNHCPELFADDALTHVLDTHDPPQEFCTDITRGLHEGWTVTFAALQIAYYLGFRQVVIIGMDHRYAYAGEPNAEGLIQGEDPNHFCAGYFGFGQKWDHPDLRNSERSYALARQVFERDGRTIIDATVDGACRVFRRADYRDLFDHAAGATAAAT